MAVKSLSILITEAKTSCCVAIFLHEHAIKRLAAIKKESNNRTASFSLKVKSEDDKDSVRYDITSHKSLIEYLISQGKGEK